MGNQSIEENDAEDLNKEKHLVNNSSSAWNQTYKILILGFFLCLFTINISYWQYILPSIGVLLLLLGMRRLSNTNRWFYAGYLCTVLNTVKWYINLFIIAAWGEQKGLSETGLMVFGVMLQIGLVFFLYLAVRQELGKYTDINKSNIILGLIIFYIFVIFLNQMEGNHPILILVFILLVPIFILSRMEKLFSEMGKSGFEPRNLSSRINSKVLFCILLLGMSLEVTATCVFVHYDFTKGTEVSDVISSSKKSKIKKLTDLGVPESIAKDLKVSDIEYLIDADRCVRTSDVISVQNREVKVTDIFFHMKNQKTYALTYFHWLSNSKIFFEDAFDIEMVYTLRPIAGNILYSRKQKEYTKKFTVLRNMTDNEYTNNVFGMQETFTKYIYTMFSFPWNSENQRGYIIFNLAAGDKSGSDIIVNYYRRINPYELPYKNVLNPKVFIRKGAAQSVGMFNAWQE